jgi:hypothetical protein
MARKQTAYLRMERDAEYRERIRVMFPSVVYAGRWAGAAGETLDAIGNEYGVRRRVVEDIG